MPGMRHSMNNFLKRKTDFILKLLKSTGSVISSDLKTWQYPIHNGTLLP